MISLVLLTLIGRASAESLPTDAATAIPVGAPSTATPVLLDRVAAVVNDDIILLSEVYAFGGPYMDQVVAAGGESQRVVAEAEVLERLLERKLISQEMRTLKLDLAEADIDRSIMEIAERNGFDVETLRREVEKSGMPWAQYRSELGESLRDMKFAQAVLRPRITITDDELKDAWLRSSGGASAASSRVQALVLAFPAGADDAQRQAVLARAEELRAQVAAGADFAALSKEFDQGPFGAQGGEMGTFRPGELVDELDTVITNAKVGEVSKPIVIGNGIYLLRVAERVAGPNDFESRRAEVADAVFESRMDDEKKRWYLEARRRAAIRILLPGVTAG